MKHTLYFTADWCAPCKKMKPIIQELVAEGVSINLVDVDLEKELAKSFNILSIPTFILFEDEKEINRISGAQTKEQLESFFNG